MKILFLQDFSLAGKGGGAAIIKRLMAHSRKYLVDTCVAYDRNSNHKISPLPGEKSFFTLPRTFRFGMGRLVGCITIFGLDIFSFFSIRKLIKQEDPDTIHLLAHGVSFPLLALAAKRSGKKVVVSVHDLWHWTVSAYISKIMADRIFNKAVRNIDTIYVISKEMEEYLAKQCGPRNYLVIHDGVAGFLINNNKNSFQQESINMLYVGVLHSMQVKQFNKLVEILGSRTSSLFKIGICSGTSYQPGQPYENIKVVNYGWLKETEVKELSLGYAYGLLPLSFDPADLLFYRTSLMTKIPFYTSVLLPVICIGPETSSTVKLIRREGTGLVAVDENGRDIPTLVDTIVSMTPAQYGVYVGNLQQSAATTFNFDHIVERFYRSL